MPSGQRVPDKVDFPYQSLRRWPDTEAKNLFASDATDRLIIDHAAPNIREATPGQVAIIGDRYGALTLAAVALGASAVRVHQDSYSSELALEANWTRLHPECPDNFEPADKQSDMPFVNLPLGIELLQGATTVLVQIPKDLNQFGHWMELVARYAAPEVTVFSGARVKHMSPAMNRILANYFDHVQVALARQKSRVLIAQGAIADVATPKIPTSMAPSGSASEETPFTKIYDGDLGLWVCSAAGAFAANRVDHGTAFLADFINHYDASEAPPTEAPLAVGAKQGKDLRLGADLGCGTGVLSTIMARALPNYQVIATDRSAAAVLSAEATLAANVPGGNWQVRRDHALSQQPDASLDLVVCNPPFHSEAAVTTELAELLFAEAARALKPGGVMLTVFNSHLPHRASLTRLVGPTEQLGRNPKFTVTKTIRR